METVSISKKIQDRIAQLDALKDTLGTLAQRKAQASAEYEKSIALTIVGLRNGKEYELDGQVITEQPTTVAEKVARGICWKEKLAADSAESAYKNAITTIGLTESQLNGYQSINRYLGET